jgi:hypothetical protein
MLADFPLRVYLARGESKAHAGQVFMETTRVNICYRPLRVAWAIRSGDRDALRQAVRLTHTLWGGRFNPIVVVDRPDEARQIIDLFRADIVWPVGVAESVTKFPELFPHLRRPFFHDSLLPRHAGHPTRAQLLDVHNMLVFSRHTPEWKAIDAQGIRAVMWTDDDPLADTFLMQYGAYPAPGEIGIDYGDLLSQVTLAINIDVDKNAPIPTAIYDHASLGYLTRHRIYRHHSVRPAWDYPGFFVGDVSDFDDLIRFWNIRAADIQVHFVDPAHMARYLAILPDLDQRMRADLLHLTEPRQRVTVWSREDNIDNAHKILEGQPINLCPIGDRFWSGAVRPPMMILGEASSLGVFSDESGKRKLSYSLNDKPFSSDNWFHSQHLVSSVQAHGADEQQTFEPPYVPEMNEFIGWTMQGRHEIVRVEPERVGVVVNACDNDSYLYALPVAAFVEKVFETIGLRAKLSAGGLITRQLIARLGGVNGARVFKIPGVRRLLKTFGPTHPFTKAAALSIIGGRDERNPEAKFSDHVDLYIEPREIGQPLTPPMVFTYLVDKGLLRIGAELKCSTCSLPSWIALDALKQSNICELCGATFDGTRQLVNGQFHYRRTGVLGLEKNSQGAIPVALVLQQLDIALGGVFRENMYTPSYELEPLEGTTLPPCEVDFMQIIPQKFPDRIEIILGECKDERSPINAADVENLRRVADALPVNRFEPYILFAKLAPFTREEVALARTLNGPYQRRVILLTARELEPYHLYERTQKETGITAHGVSADELAAVTAHLYFTEQALATVTSDDPISQLDTPVEDPDSCEGA